jgi:hypothetical protein
LVVERSDVMEEVVLDGTGDVIRELGREVRDTALGRVEEFISW